jgi:hypothetical protein
MASLHKDDMMEGRGGGPLPPSMPTECKAKPCPLQHAERFLQHAGCALFFTTPPRADTEHRRQKKSAAAR